MALNEGHLMVQKTILVYGVANSTADETRVYRKGETYINGCSLPDEVDKLRSGTLTDTEPGNVVAIDFGTTCCTLAYFMKGDRDDEIRYLRHDSDNPRIPTSIVIDDDGNVYAFGRDAQKKYAKLTDQQKQTHHFFHQIKMNLQHDKNVNWTYEIVAINGKHFFLLEVIAMILKYLKNKFLAIEVHGGIRGALDMEDFKWVLTVPAMWKARGKQMMREAAYKAGIGSKEGIITRLTEVRKTSSQLLQSAPTRLSSTSANPYLLSLALEPEAAAVHCLQQAKKTGAIADPKCYLVLDIGGGTVDITAHKINDNGSIDVVLPPTGNDWGGVRVNQEFKEFLGNLIDDPHFQQYLNGPNSDRNARHQAELQNIVDYVFEDQKQIFGSEENREVDGKYAMINLPWAFMRVYEDKLTESMKSLNDPQVELLDSDLSIGYKRMEEFFQPAIDEIIAAVESSFKILPKDITIDTAFLVGGFGACRYMHDMLLPKLKRIFSKVDIQVFRPDHHRLAVVNGAIETVLNRAVVRSRVVDATYGSACSLPFNVAIHDAKQKFYDDDRRERCNNLILPFALKGDVVQAGRVLVQSYFPLKHNQTSMIFSLFSSQSRNVRYVKTSNDQSIEGVNCIGQLTVQMPIQRGDKNREVKLVFDFTHSEIQVEAFDITSGTRVSTVLDFLTDSYCEKVNTGYTTQ